AEYPVAPLSQSANKDQAIAFIEYILSAQGQSVLQKWGFASAE
ncbi:MAG: substrate-binding domain-containing protein, partial [Anaerolineales bacterium]